LEKALLLVSAFIVQILKLMKKILLIEDEFYILDLYRIILEKAGFEVLLAEDGEKGYNLAQNLPNLILLDIMLPKMNGIILLKKLKEEDLTKNIPVVLLSNLGQEEVIKTAFDSGASGYFLKVRLSPDELVKKVNIFIENPNFKMDHKTLVFD